MKTTFLTTTLLSIAFFAFSQNFYGGFSGGFNSTQLDGDALRGYHNIGLATGIWMQYDISEQFFWGAELKYSEKGSRKNPTRLNPDRYIYRLNYVDLPVYYGYWYQPTVAFIGGASFNYLANAHASSLLASNIEGFSNLIDKWELALLLGVKIDFESFIKQTWAKNLMLDLRLNYSLFSIYDNSNPNIFNKHGLYNNVVSTVLYYRIDL